MRDVLGSIVLATEHFGSSAVPGLLSKPIIDILVGVRDLGEAKLRAPALAALGYENFGEIFVPGRLYLRKRSALPHFNVAITELGSPFWATNLIRSALRRADAVPEHVRDHPRHIAETRDDSLLARDLGRYRAEPAPQEREEGIRIDPRHGPIERTEAHRPIAIEDERGRVCDAALLLAVEDPVRLHHLAVRVREQLEGERELLLEGARAHGLIDRHGNQAPPERSELGRSVSGTPPTGGDRTVTSGRGRTPVRAAARRRDPRACEPCRSCQAV